MSKLFRNWRMSYDPSISNHRIIQFEIEGNPEKEKKTRNPRRTDYNSSSGG